MLTGGTCGVALTPLSVATGKDARVNLRDRCGRPAAEHPIEPASVADVAGAVAALRTAFDDYAWTRWIVPADDHEGRLTGLFEITVSRIGLGHGDVRVARCPLLGGTVVGASVVLRPDRPVPDAVWAEVAPVEQRLLGDRLGVADEAEAACAPLRPAVPHVTVATVGVRPDHQGRGIATALIQSAFDIARALGVPVYLETSSESNVALYRRLGFEVIGQVRVAQDGPFVWAMCHD